MKAWLTLAFAVLFAASPLFTAPFTGFRADQLPVPQVDPPAQPAGWAFAIWLPIYGWLILSGAYGVLRRCRDADWQAPRLPLIASLAIGSFWLWTANRSAEAATLLIWAMLALALLALYRTPARDRWLLQAPVALYAGWLTAAAQVSLASVMAGYGLLAGARGWAYLALALALALGAAMQVLLRRAPEYAAAIVWALTGIVAANGLARPGIAATALGGVVVLAGLAWWAERAGPAEPRERRAPR